MPDVPDREATDVVPGHPDATAWRRAARRHQHRWRTSNGWPAGTQALRPPKEGTRLIGSRINSDFAKWTAANFLTDDAREAVANRVAHPEKSQTIDLERLRCDLLSSMPMCFNLFGPLWRRPDLASAVVNRWFPDLCPPGASVTVKFEWSPGRGDPSWLGDRTAFDVALCINDDDEQRLIGIETKYHEFPKAPSRSRSNPRYQEVTSRAGLFLDPTEIAIVAESELEQLWRDHLLVLACQQHDAGPSVVRYVLAAPAANPSWQPLAATYRNLLSPSTKPTFEYRSLESLLTEAADLLPHSSEFRARYLDVDMVDCQS